MPALSDSSVPLATGDRDLIWITVLLSSLGLLSFHKDET